MAVGEVCRPEVGVRPGLRINLALTEPTTEIGSGSRLLRGPLKGAADARNAEGAVL
jgi:hypothetical protein